MTENLYENIQDLNCLIETIKDKISDKEYELQNLEDEIYEVKNEIKKILEVAPYLGGYANVDY